jgi:hypothetical protein
MHRNAYIEVARWVHLDDKVFDDVENRFNLCPC